MKAEENWRKWRISAENENESSVSKMKIIEISIYPASMAASQLAKWQYESWRNQA